jgi:hypothetical protein
MVEGDSVLLQMELQTQEMVETPILNQDNLEG